ncbi:hypothetical protein [Cupriavidus necator]|uniref:hypothetical protein n=1 Tax=Cupriavidus necator TaxID=106590 RepID=UPI0005B4692D|nr:hypothetical protein [Cupriavidus necator]
MFKHWVWQFVRRFSLIAAICLSAGGIAHAAIDVNTADEAALTSVKGVGPKSVAKLQEAGLTFGAAAAAPAASAKPAKAAAAAPAGAAKASR